MQFADLSGRFLRNEDNDPNVAALNQLTEDERNLFIMYILLDNNKKALSEILNVSRVYIRDRLWRIQVRMIELIENQKKRENENLF